MLMPNRSSEDTRYLTYRLGAHGAWWAAFGWTAALTWVNLTRPVTALPSTFQRVSGLFIILLMGVAIALGSALARMRLGATIAQVFQTGLSAAVSLHAASGAGAGGAGVDVCVVRCNLSGVIESVEHGDVIGWGNGEADSLTGTPMDDLIPDRYLRINHAALAQYRTATVEDTGVVVTFNVPIKGGDGKERAMRMTIARLGDTLIKTLVPVAQHVLTEGRR